MNEVKLFAQGANLRYKVRVVCFFFLGLTSVLKIYLFLIEG